LWNCRIGDEVRAFQAALQTTRTLKVLSLWNCRIGDETSVDPAFIRPSCFVNNKSSRRVIIVNLIIDQDEDDFVDDSSFGLLLPCDTPTGIRSVVANCDAISLLVSSSRHLHSFFSSSGFQNDTKFFTRLNFDPKRQLLTW
jgi:hypothetical protein